MDFFDQLGIKEMLYILCPCPLGLPSNPGNAPRTTLTTEEVHRPSHFDPEAGAVCGPPSWSRVVGGAFPAVHGVTGAPQRARAQNIQVSN